MASYPKYRSADQNPATANVEALLGTPIELAPETQNPTGTNVEPATQLVLVATDAVPDESDPWQGFDWDYALAD